MRLLLLSFLALFTNNSFSQLKINDEANKEELINIIANNEPGITINNIKQVGFSKSFGIFKSNFKHNEFPSEGIIISTGNANDAIGPNNNTSKSVKINRIADRDILTIDNNNTSFDTAYLEFDLQADSDEIQFNFLFASEEYPEYVNKNVNDTFIFLLTDLSTGKTKNLALLHQKIPVSVDNINHIDYSDYYISNPPFKKENLQELKNNLKSLELSYYFQFDGLTKLITAKTNVNPNNKYRLKMVISDVGDQLFDSAIFIEANSLRSTGKKAEKEVFRKDVLRLNFDFNDYTIKDTKDHEKLDKVAKYLMTNNSIEINIIGHTDKKGSLKYNQKLSKKRAMSVKQYFINKGVESSRISALGKGTSQPIGMNPTENRRVEIEYSKHN